MCLLTEADSVAHSLQSTTRTSCGTCSRVTAAPTPAISPSIVRSPPRVSDSRSDRRGGKGDRWGDTAGSRIASAEPPCNNRLRVFRSRSRSLFVSECKALIFSDVALEGFRFPAITFAKFAGSSSNSFANTINPISSRFAFSQDAAAAHPRASAPASRAHVAKPAIYNRDSPQLENGEAGHANV